jgi:hypothetical protein
MCRCGWVPQDLRFAPFVTLEVSLKEILVWKVVLKDKICKRKSKTTFSPFSCGKGPVTHKQLAPSANYKIPPSKGSPRYGGVPWDILLTCFKSLAVYLK